MKIILDVASQKLLSSFGVGFRLCLKSIFSESSFADPEGKEFEGNRNVVHHSGEKSVVVHHYSEAFAQSGNDILLRDSAVEKTGERHVRIFDF